MLVGKNNNLEEGNLVDTTIVGNSLTTEECYLHDYNGYNYINPDEPLNYNGERIKNPKGTKPTFIFGRYKKEGSDSKSGYFIKLDDNGSSFIRAKDLTVVSDDLYSEGPITTPIVNARDYLFQNPGINENKPSEEMYNALVPNAGTITTKQYSDGYLNNCKTFIGTVSGLDNIDKYVISIRERNGYGSKDIFKLVYDCTSARLSFNKTDSKTGKITERTVIDTEGNQTINNTLTVVKQLKIGKEGEPGIILNPNSESTFANNIRAFSFIANSARSLKTDIKPTKYNAVDEINKIDVVDFYFKSDSKKENPKVGFIADDTDPIFSTKEKNSMDLYNTCGMLLKAVQELSAENKELRKRIEKLEK